MINTKTFCKQYNEIVKKMKLIHVIKCKAYNIDISSHKFLFVQFPENFNHDELIKIVFEDEDFCEDDMKEYEDTSILWQELNNDIEYFKDKYKTEYNNYMNSLIRSDIEAKIMEFKSKYIEGFVSEEVEFILKIFNDVDMNIFDDELSGISCKVKNNETVYYRHDICNAIIKGLKLI